MIYAGFYLLLAIFSPTLVRLFLALPNAVIATITGLALIPALMGSVESMLATKDERDTAILTFLYSWNEFLFALSFTLGPERYTVPVAITLFRGQYQVPWGQILAAAVVATVPVAAIVLVAQRRIVAGLTSGAVKG